MKGDDLKQRTKVFALRVIKVCEALPKSVTGRAVANQLIRCGTSVAANYRAACRGRSRAEFIAKIGVVEEEADESCFWLEVIMDCKLLASSKVEPLLAEANEIVAIMATSYISAGRNGASVSIQKSAFRNQKSKP